MIPEIEIGMGTYSAILIQLPTFNYANLPRALYVGLISPTIIGRDIVKWGLSTHFTSERKLGKIRADLT